MSIAEDSRLAAATPSPSLSRKRERNLGDAEAQRRREQIVKWSSRLGSLVVLLALWEVFGRHVNKAVFAPPSRVVAAGIEMVQSGELWKYLQGSLLTLVYGLAISIAIGLPVGILMARSKVAGYALEWYIAAFNSTPMVALIPLITLVFGFDLTAKVIVVVISSLFAIIINTEQGVRNVDARLLEVAQAFRSSERALWGDVILPSALPYIAAGMRLAVGRALVGMVVAEFFTAVSGVGYLIVRYSNSFEPDHLLVPIVVVMALGIVLTAITTTTERRVAPWNRQKDD
ncbi:MAG TPA: ABC transporter permease [Chloroflexota bacterium]|nr:ABC transporter permease [Chloroflexota bacterium]